MTTKTHTQKTSSTFSGLGDWFEVFRAGEQTDSKGNTKTWTPEDLDSMVANHDAANPAPLVVGHPKTDDPAYGWTASLKRDGNVLLAKAADVAPEFEAAVEAKHYRKRSVSIVPADNGFALRHIGFLGAVAPAVDGLKDIQFNDDDSAVAFEFSVDDAVRNVSWSLRTIGELFRRFKNKLIEQDGLEAADEQIPEYALEALTQAPSDVRTALAEGDQYFNKDSNKSEQVSEEDSVSEFTQAQLDEAVAKATGPLQEQIDQMKSDKAQSEFEQRKNEAQTVVNGLIDEGKVLPAQVNGLAEFMAELSAEEDAQFEFSVGDGDSAETKKQSPFEFMKGFLGGLGKQLEFNRASGAGDDLDEPSQHNYQAPAGTVVDQNRAELDRKAMEYSEQHGVDYVTALSRVSEEG